eukprot:Platyproteum_vivax@DN2380_c0_g1_i1.p1
MPSKAPTLRVVHVADSITGHAFSPHKKYVAICPPDHSIEIWQLPRLDGHGSENKLITTLSAHTCPIQALDWHHDIVSISVEGETYVWTPTNPNTFDEWSRKRVEVVDGLVCVAWSADGSMLAIGTATGQTVVCWKKDDEWVSKTLARAHTGCILSVSWHPSGLALCSASVDGWCCLCAVPHPTGRRLSDLPDYAKLGKDQDNGLSTGKGDGDAGPFGDGGEETENRHVFLRVSLQKSDKGRKVWLTDGVFSPTGKILACAGSNSCLLFQKLTDHCSCQEVRWRGLPFLQLLFLSESALVAVGHDCTPVVFSLSALDAKWRMAYVMDSNWTGASSIKAPSNETTLNRIFKEALLDLPSDELKEKDNENKENKEHKEDELEESLTKEKKPAKKRKQFLPTIHQSPIKCVRRHVVSATSGWVSSFSTSEVLGRVVVWNSADLSLRLAQLSIQFSPIKQLSPSDTSS